MNDDINILNQIKKAFNRVSSRDENIQLISTGIPQLDNIIKYPVGGIIEILGESSIKSTISYYAALSFQKEFTEKIILYIASNGIYNKHWSDIIGVNNNDVCILYENDIEKIFDIIKIMILNSVVSLIIIDDLPSLTIKNVEEDDDVFIARSIKLGVHIENIIQYLKHYKCSMFIINYFRSDNKTGFCENILQKYANVRMSAYPLRLLKDKYIISGIKILKNDFGEDNNAIELKLDFNIGISKDHVKYKK